MESIQKYVYDDEELREYFPEERDFHMLEKSFVCDLCYSVKREDFAEWVEKRIAARNKKMATVKDS
jgi:hypothetical protein